MLSATTSLTHLDLAHAAGHVRAALERVGCEDVFLLTSSDGFRARGIRGRSALATIAACTPLVLTGAFSRCAVEVALRRSLDAGDDCLRLTVRVRCLREFEDHEEEDWITRGPGEMLGDMLQGRRVLRLTLASLDRPTDAGPIGFGHPSDRIGDTEERRARFQDRYRRGRARRRWQAVSSLAVVAGVVALRLWLEA